MTRRTAEAVIEYISDLVKTDFNLTFHGGEPLLAGKDFYRWILPILRERFGLSIHIGIQSNLWAVDDEFAELFSKYMVSVGTSLDGPKDMCDGQRGTGYYDKTMAGMELLSRHGVAVKTIATFTEGFSNMGAAVYDSSRLSYAIHPAVPILKPDEISYDNDTTDTVMKPVGLKNVLLDTYEAYKNDLSHNHVLTLDSIAKGMLHGSCELCTFTDCLGQFAVIDPKGDIYSCQRFAGNEEYKIGNVFEDPYGQKITESPGYKKLKILECSLHNTCADCEHFAICKGGCMYNALMDLGRYDGSHNRSAVDDRSIVSSDTDNGFDDGISKRTMIKDPYCEAYKAVFDAMKKDMAGEMAASMLGKNFEAKVLAMAGENKHPADIRKTKELLSYAVRAGKMQGKPKELCGNHYPFNELNKLYLHITYRCELRCDHCYIRGGEAQCDELSPEKYRNIIKEAADSCFRSIVITGGEPFLYPHFEELCDMLSHVDMKGTKLILRTALVSNVEKSMLRKVCALFDEVIVSIDGDRETHDRRRGSGTYDIAVGRIKLIKEMGFIDKVGIAAVLSKEEAEGEAGKSVSRLARELGIRKLRIRNKLPLGRAEGTVQEKWQKCTDEAVMSDSFCIRESCGLGHNLFVKPDGSVFPCYAWCKSETKLGDLKGETLRSILTEGGLFKYTRHDVDTNEKCKYCEVRYLCGGICKAWVKNDSNVDSGNFDCSDRKEYFLRIAENIGKE